MATMNWPAALVAVALIGGAAFGVHSCAEMEAKKEQAKQQAKADMVKECAEEGGSFRTTWLLGRPRCKLPTKHKRSE